MPTSSARPVDTKTRRVLLRAIPLSLVAAIVALVLFAWLAEEVLEAGTKHFDDSVHAAVHQHASPALTVFMRGITLLGSMEVLLPAVLFVLTFLLVRGKRYEAIVLSVTMAGGLILNIVLKWERILTDESSQGHGMNPGDTEAVQAQRLLIRIDDGTLPYN